MVRPMELRYRLRGLLEAGEFDTAWSVLEERRDELGVDRDFSLMWLSAAGIAPRRSSPSEIEMALATWPSDPEVVIVGCAGLMAVTERRAPDEPILDQGPAYRSAIAARVCLESLDEAQAQDPDIGGLLWIHRANALRRCSHAEDQAAQDAFAKALALSPGNGHFLFDLGLLHKWRGRWQEALDANLSAKEAVADPRGALWNVCVCATALGKGDVAAAAWRELGLPAEVVPSSGMPYVPDVPPAQVRVPARGPGVGAGWAVPDDAASFEVVWVAPLSPCHGVVQSATFRDAVVDYGDVILWDGAPVAVTDFEGRPVPCFPLLEILLRGDEHRLRFAAHVRGDEAVDAFSARLPEGVKLQRHVERAEWVAPDGSRGLIEATEAKPEGLVYGKLLAPADANLEVLRDVVEAASKELESFAIAVPGLYEALGDTRRAGQEHQAFRGIERRAEKRG